MKRIHYLQHVPFEGLGSIATWAEEKGIPTTSTQLYRESSFPEQTQFDCLIVMGGPMSIHDEADYPWLKPEKVFIKEAIDAGKIVLGICLGGQLIADVLGAEIAPNQHREIGWFPLGQPPASPNHLPISLETLAFHWHGETFGIPPQATLIASSEACENQGFIYKSKVIALQFHFETTPQSAQALIQKCADEIVEGPYIQNAKTMLQHPENFLTINKKMVEMLNYLEQTK